jgi:mono/diheme cytochrome c family protein
MRPIHALPVVLVAAALAGCGSGSSPSGSAATQQPSAATQTQTSTTTSAAKPSGGGDGAKVFASAGCAGCHTLKAAGASGGVGPNLDNLKPSFDAVKAQVTNGGGGMPAFGGDLTSAEIDAVASYVSASAGQ